MFLFDIHSHKISGSSSAIVSFDANQDLMDERIVYASVGIHPWFLTEENSLGLYDCLRMLVKDERVIAIGEAGLDKIKGTSLELQIEVFRKEVLLAEECKLPMVIHCVRAYNELIQLKKRWNPQQPWIIHGFRGNETVVKELLQHGCWISLGARFQENALKEIPIDRLFLETDEANDSIRCIYERVAQVKGMSLEELDEIVKMNVWKVFFKQ